MKILLQISIEVNSGSVGRIAEQIGVTAIQNGWQSYITYARNNLPSQSKTIRIGSYVDVYYHVLQTRLFDNHCLASKSATYKLINKINEIKPDIIQMHHIHGYFINMEVLFNYLKGIKIPIVWVFHDCWAFTGHCAYFDFVGCQKWKTECYECEQKNEYPKSLLKDNSTNNYNLKKTLFTNIENMHIVCVSNWLKNNVQQSFLKDYPLTVIHNGIDTNVFKPYNNKKYVFEKYSIKTTSLVIGVANIWERRKGLNDILKLREILDSNCTILLVGLNKKQLADLPKGIVGVLRTESIHTLAELYSAADVFINPTWEDTYPTTNLEAMACGTPVVTYETGGSVESLTTETGIVVNKGSVVGMNNAIDKILNYGKGFYSENCRKRAENFFDKKFAFEKYLHLYNQLLND